LYHVENK